MSKALSLDLRVRILAAVAGGMSHRAAGKRFGVSAASVSRWRMREREQGDARPKALGGDRRSQRIDAHIFFDDQEKHVLDAAAVVPAGHVPGPHDPVTPVIPAG